MRSKETLIQSIKKLFSRLSDIAWQLTITYYFLRYEKHRAFTITIILFTGIVVVASALIEFPEINIRIYET